MFQPSKVLACFDEMLTFPSVFTSLLSDAHGLIINMPCEHIPNYFAKPVQGKIIHKFVEAYSTTQCLNIITF